MAKGILAAKGKGFIASTKIEVGAAGGKGRGVFAREAIKRGRLIEKAPALLIPRAEVDELLASFLAHYIFRTDTGYRYVLGLGFASLFNHSESPNAAFSVCQDWVKITAIRDIKAGSEVTMSYGWTAREWAEIGGQLL